MGMGITRRRRAVTEGGGRKNAAVARNLGYTSFIPIQYWAYGIRLQRTNKKRTPQKTGPASNAVKSSQPSSGDTSARSVQRAASVVVGGAPVFAWLVAYRYLPLVG